MFKDKFKQEISNFIEFLENYLNEIKQYLNNNESLKEVLLSAKDKLAAVKESFKALLIKGKELGVNVIEFINNYIKESAFIQENKKPILVSSLCLSAGIFSFLFAFNGDIFRIDINAQDNVEINNLSNSSNLEFPTVSVNGQNFATDAKLVADKLNNFDYYNNGEKVVYLTFDDGPSKYTDDILDILKKYNIRATFFNTGTSLENANEDIKESLRKSYAYGNSIGNHTYSHDYNKLYPNKSLNLNSFKEDLEKNDALLKGILGENFETNIVRCPGGSMSWNNMDSLNSYLENTNKASIDWNALTGDSSSRNKTKDVMIENAIKTSQGKNLVVLLMHETNKLTPEYLDDIIRYYHSNGYTFKTLA